jgi:hypothetical protein
LSALQKYRYTPGVQERHREDPNGYDPSDDGERTNYSVSEQVNAYSETALNATVVRVEALMTAGQDEYP